MSKHTPGPWVVGSDRYTALYVHAVGGDEPMICKVNEIEPEPGAVGCGGNPDANAALIAAAPDLLAALKGVVQVADRATIEFDAARKAILKAEGRA